MSPSEWNAGEDADAGETHRALVRVCSWLLTWCDDAGIYTATAEARGTSRTFIGQGASLLQAMTALLERIVEEAGR